MIQTGTLHRLAVRYARVNENKNAGLKDRLNAACHLQRPQSRGALDVVVQLRRACNGNKTGSTEAERRIEKARSS